MPIRTEHIINAVDLDSASESVAANFQFRGVVPKRITLYVRIVETQDNGNPTTTLTVEFSPDGGATLITTDKLLTDAGTDGPVASVAYTATVDDIVSIPPEDVVEYMRVTMSGSSDMDAGDHHVVDVWLVFAF
jgi:hypothetical protein